MNKQALKIMVTGGAGYIGSHICVELLSMGYTPVVIDNLSNSCIQSIERINEISGVSPIFVEADVCDRDSLLSIFTKHDIHAVIHLAGLKSVSESAVMPISYYKANIVGTLNLLDVMAVVGVKAIVFSSSAAVYGDPEYLPIKENSARSAVTPYARSKLFIEEILSDINVSDSSWSVSLLRYFNPVGAHKSGLIGEDPKGVPDNLMPSIARVATGVQDKLTIFGGDYATSDGTGVRDYIHVVDLARGHINALEKLAPGLAAYNLGTGRGYSVLELVAAFEQASGKPIPYEIADRRPHDVAACYSDVQLALEKLDWKAEYGLREMCEDTWRWQNNNPDGYCK